MPCATISKNSGASDMDTEIRKLENEEIRKLENEEMTIMLEMPIIPIIAINNSN